MHNIILKNTKKTVKYINFVNPEIPGLSAAQSRDFGIGKFPGLQSLFASRKSVSLRFSTVWMFCAIFCIFPLCCNFVSLSPFCCQCQNHGEWSLQFNLRRLLRTATLQVTGPAVAFIPYRKNDHEAQQSRNSLKQAHLSLIFFSERELICRRPTCVKLRPTFDIWHSTLQKPIPRNVKIKCKK